MSHEFRCPVCNHADAVDLPRGEGSREVPCSHCGTGLTLELRDDADLTLDVRVSASADHGAPGSS